MSFPSKFPGRCRACGGPIATGEPIEYDRASKAAYHARCAGSPAAASEPGDEAIEIAPTRPAQARPARRPAAPKAETPPPAERPACGLCGLADGRELVHRQCVADEREVPF